MSDIRINDLPQISIIDNSNDMLPIVDVSTNITKKISSDQITSTLSSSVNILSQSLSNRITNVSSSVPIVTGSINYIPIFSGNNKLINSRIFYDSFPNLYTVDGSITVNNNSLFKGDTTFENGINLYNPNNILNNFITLGSERILFISDTGEGLILTSQCQDDTSLTLKSWNGSTTLTLGEDEITTNRKVTINGSLTVTDEIIAEQFHTLYVTSSIIYSSGSTKFGDSSDDTHRFTGSVNIQGDVGITNTLTTLGQTYLYNELHCYGFASFDEPVDFNNSVSINGVANFNNDAIFGGSVEVNGTTNLHGNLDVTGVSEFNTDVTVVGSTNFGTGKSSTSTFTGDVTIHDDLLVETNFQVNGTSTLNNGVTINGGTTITENVILNSQLRVDDETNLYGQFNCNSFSLFDNQAQFNSDIVVGGNIIANGSIVGNGIVTGSAFNKYATTSSLNILSSSVDSRINILSSSVNVLSSSYSTHTHSNLNNNLSITGSLNVSGGNLKVGTNSIFISSSGDIGIGTIAPISSSNIHIVSNNKSLVLQQSVAGSVFNGIEFLDYTGLLDSSIKVNQATGEFRTFVKSGGYFPTFYSNGNEIMRISTNGNIGVSTIAPTAKLHISGTTTTETLLNIQNNLGNNVLFISSSKNIGIGTNTPSASLDVSGSFRMNLRTITNSTDAGVIGEKCYDANYYYVCTATNTWKRSPLSTW